MLGGGKSTFLEAGGMVCSVGGGGRTKKRSGGVTGNG